MTISIFLVLGVCVSPPIFVQPPEVNSANVQGCTTFDKEESKNDYSNCEDTLRKWYPCPKKPQNFDTSTLGASPPVKDADWAILEVTTGMSRWEYDICCDDGANPERRDDLFRSNYCAKDICEFRLIRYQNYDDFPAFCIRSPRLACSASFDSVAKNTMVTNQCCYSSVDGSLFDGNSNNPLNNLALTGSMQLEVNSMSNMIAHYQSELSPFRQCCRLSPIHVSNSDCSTVFKKHRPTIVGEYWPRNVILNRGDPHLSTIDGLFYPFMGIGVYTMLTTQTGKYSLHKTDSLT